MISLITINKNNLSGLKKTVESVTSQTYRDFKWYIIDGLSTDGSIDYINNINFPSLIRVIEPDKGIYSAMNKGIDLVDNENLVLFLNSGDSLSNKHVLSKVRQYSKQTDILICNYIKQIEDKCITVKNPESLNILWLFSKTINHQSYFTKGSLLKKYKFDEKYKIASDWMQLFSILYYEGSISCKKLDLIITNYEGGGISELFNDKRIAERESYLREKLSKNVYDSFLEIGGLVAKSNFKDLLKLASSKWRWKVVVFWTRVLSTSNRG